LCLFIFFFFLFLLSDGSDSNTCLDEFNACLTLNRTINTLVFADIQIISGSVITDNPLTLNDCVISIIGSALSSSALMMGPDAGTFFTVSIGHLVLNSLTLYIKSTGNREAFVRVTQNGGVNIAGCDFCVICFCEYKNCCFCYCLFLFI
jgi:hypothetical protein